MPDVDIDPPAAGWPELVPVLPPACGGQAPAAASDGHLCIGGCDAVALAEVG